MLTLSEYNQTLPLTHRVSVMYLQAMLLAYASLCRNANTVCPFVFSENSYSPFKTLLNNHQLRKILFGNPDSPKAK